MKDKKYINTQTYMHLYFFVFHMISFTKFKLKYILN